ncbi:class I SAM-dependent methyltransferase [Streptomyces albus]|uniref:class I SAM-dependent methyltransferase n=1 Tax=Streptomyces albus TaxID=1888 RepID=UPI00146FEC73|nr:class I SAM-dependent methyltransferase [Streptomyces albus]
MTDARLDALAGGGSRFFLNACWPRSHVSHAMAARGLLTSEGESVTEPFINPYPSYDSAEATASYLNADRATDWLLGHTFVFAELALSARRKVTVLDFGCGPGAVTDHIARRYGARVLAADTAPDILRAARERGTPGAEYHLITDNRVDGLPDACADAAMCSFVLTCVPDEEVHRSVMSELRRLLRPGARLALLNTDPACYGLTFTSVRTGEAATQYRPGDPVPVHLRAGDGKWETFTNYYWPLHHYPELLAEADFTDITQYRPTVEQAEVIADRTLFLSSSWEAERARPPMVITAATA